MTTLPDRLTTAAAPAATEAAAPGTGVDAATGSAPADAAVEAILRGHPAVVDAAVLTGPDPVLVVVPMGFLNGPEVRAILRAALPGQPVPDRVAVVEELPRLADGTVDRERLDRRIGSLPGGVYQFEPPADDLERQIAELWLELLDCPEVGATDDFIDVGGDSMSGIELVNLIDERFGIAIELDEIFQNTTVRGLAAAIRGRDGDTPAAN